MLSGTGTEAKPPMVPLRPGTANPGVLPSWKFQFQKMSVPVMAIGANLSTGDSQEDAWATAVYWNEIVDDIDNHPDGNSFLQAYTMAVQARAKTRIPPCYRYGERGHMRDKCAYTDDVCFRCKKPGHKSEACTVPR